ncbi:MAG TPA: hypothetical protein VM658_17060 [bacterium]|nr:hypothetical protein [bacterium]
MIEDPTIKGWILKAEGDFAVAEHELSLTPEKMVREAAGLQTPGRHGRKQRP